ncbi:glycerophosphodiester phosphodiesterase [Brachybacterium fresconis]|uniref:Glycerophosphoryl diester phosphodiesterase n=1 Tax=Brachybacterium fresconis TaxID=173363 RepID=A0ABS4YLT5_9MICO|nr:glycerophosphodiester phosphodiesterase [Brachybacterium fresconis]MBP2409748.1 glycerophosphoryl diester phosphodiesterase [Brachybacterium fresconis]
MTSSEPTRPGTTFTIVGHRGAMASVLENTIASFEEAERVGCQEIELDIRPSADGRLVLTHDRSLDRMMAEQDRGLGPVDTMNWAALQKVELRDGHRVATLEEAVAATSVFLQVEIKDPAVVPLLADRVDKLPALTQRVRLTSFDTEALVHARQLMPQIPRGQIIHGLPLPEDRREDLESLLQRTGADALYCGWTGLTAEVVADQHAAGRLVHGWPTRSEEDLALALELGLDGTTADDPEAAIGWYEQARAAAG